jgi:hypothetical protein
VPDRIESLAMFLYEIDAWPRLKRIRVAPLLYRELLLRMYDQEEGRPMIFWEKKPTAFLLGVPVECDPTLTNVAFELDYA